MGNISVKSVLCEGWELYKKNFVRLCAYTLLWFIILGVIASLLAYLGFSGHFFIGKFILVLICFLLSIGMLQAGFHGFILDLIRGKKVDFKTIFRYKNKFLSFSAIFILTLILQGIGYILLILPGILLNILFSLVWYIAADEPDLGIIATIRKSFDMVSSQFVQILVCYFVFFLLGILILFLYLFANLGNLLTDMSVNGWSSAIVRIVFLLFNGYMFFVLAVFYEKLKERFERFRLLQEGDRLGFPSEQ